jgi:hypothetical protein
MVGFFSWYCVLPVDAANHRHHTLDLHQKVTFESAIGSLVLQLDSLCCLHDRVMGFRWQFQRGLTAIHYIAVRWHTPFSPPA